MGSPTNGVDELRATLTSLRTGVDGLRPREALERYVNALTAASMDPSWKDGHDLLGQTYEQLVPGYERRALGQFFTPIQIARAMASWVLSDPVDTLLDAGCGSGTLLIAATHTSTRPANLVGIELDPLLAKLAQKNLEVRRASDVVINVGDFLLDDFAITPDAVICNPPYTRHHALSSEYKEALYSGFEARLGLHLHETSSAHVLFLLRAIEIAAEGAKLAFITPSHWLDIKYSQKVKQYVLDRCAIEAVIELPKDRRVFPHAATSAAITLIRKTKQRRQRTRYVRLSTVQYDKWLSGHQDQQFGKYARPKTRPIANRSLGSSPRERTLSEFADVHRGVATGCNGFFVLSENDRRSHGISKSSLRPCLAGPRFLPGTHFTDEDFCSMPDEVPKWLLMPSRRLNRGPLADYLELGEQLLKVPERTLIRQRTVAGRPWYQSDQGYPAPLVFTYFNRNSARFVRNIIGAIPLNTWLAITPHDDVDPDQLFNVLSNAAVLKLIKDRARHYGTGLWKVEPSELARIPLDWGAI